MRQYRGWSKNGWVYGWYSEYICPEYGNKICAITDAENNEHEVDPKTAGQLTGLKDMHNKLSYKGDIIIDVRTSIVFEIVWNDEYAGWWCVSGDKTIEQPLNEIGKHCIVSGTIHTKEESNG